MRRTCIFSGSSHPALVDAICDRLGCKPAQAALKKFSNGETSVEIKTSVRDQDVFIVQSGSSKINDNVMELLIMINACRGGSPKSITAVMPYFPYSRQSKKKSHRGAITARMLANLMNVAGVNHVITIDLHASQMQGFFKCSVDNLVAQPLLSKWIRMNIPGWQDSVVVSKNPGGTKRVTSLADALKLSFGVVTTDRRRTYIPASMYNSGVLESPILDGSNDHHLNEKDGHDSDGPVFSSPVKNGSGTIEQDFAPFGSPTRHRAVSGLSASRFRMGNGEPLPSPLSQSIRRESTNTDEHGAGARLARVITDQSVRAPRDEDGYEDPESEDDQDEAPRDVITGRLIHGHIVDEEVPSPPMSVSSDSVHGNQTNPSEEDIPLHMTQSFMSTTSSRAHFGQGLGGTGDATASDEEEEENLKNPQIETRVTLVGNVRDKPVLIVDDMIDKAGSWIAAAETVVKRGGATKVYCMATHGLFGGDSLAELDACDEIAAIIVTDAFPIPAEKKQGIRKLVVLDSSALLSEAIRRNHHGESISQLYNQYFD